MCRGFLGVLLSVLLAPALFDTGAATAQYFKQIEPTEKHIQGFMAAYDIFYLFLNETKVQAPDKSGFLQKNSKRNSFYFRNAILSILEKPNGTAVFSPVSRLVSSGW